MRTMTRSVLAVVQLGLIVLAVSACASSQLTPTASTTTLMAGWQYRFKLDWAVAPEQAETRRILGNISSQHGEDAVSVRLLAQAFDASGKVVGQRIAWVPGGVSGFARVSFVVTSLPAADHYAVTVWDYTFFQGGPGMFR
jgi:hypothetical protein